MKPKITIVTVTYNASKSIESTIKSVIGQTYSNKEYIIIDGCSTDGTQEMVIQYEDYIDIFVSEQDKGIYDAMNKAIDIASGEWIIFMNAGDLFYNESVLSEVFELDIYEKIDVIYGSTCYKYTWGNAIIPSKNYTELKKRMPFVHQSVFVRTSILKKRHYDINYKICADFDFFHWLYKQRGVFKQIETIISIYRTDGISRMNIIKEYDEISSINETRPNLMFTLRRNLFIVRNILSAILPDVIINWYRIIRYK